MKPMPALQEVETCFGHKMHVDPTDYIGQTIIREGAFDRPGLVFMTGLMDRMRARQVLDIGGNIGNHALVFSRHAQRVWTFEPNPAAWRIMEKNIEINEVSNITLCRFGLSESDVDADMYVNTSGNLGGSTLRAESRAENHAYHTTTVPLRRGDAWAEEQLDGPIDFVKLDIEGHEGAALTGLRETILKHRPVIIMEWNQISDREGVCESAVFKEIAETYMVYGLYKASEKKYWRQKPMGALRRLWAKLTRGKALTAMPLEEVRLYPGLNVRDLLLVPNEKNGLLS
ncbi:methyltransferase FkbM [Alcanivorax sp. S71-1-4]|uniref:FkbM family methyltransferase n=1 Tax=Alcanivorax sp. S71-1-4 TaxID=1177159 RepID=UPI001358B1C8|nr:FkbM family methyltransferase [Alcanivorax sp. S71-1-4]KAF0811127.1 methyltransferase FkbM [Alcanivorax sp. S71-1-4]